MFVELHYLFTLFTSSPNRTPKCNGYGCAEMRVSIIRVHEQRDRCILLATLPGEMQIVHIGPLLYTDIFLYTCMYGYAAETTA